METGKPVGRHILRVVAFNAGGAPVEITEGAIEDLDRSWTWNPIKAAKRELRKARRGGIGFAGLYFDDSPNTIPFTLAAHHQAVWLLDLRKIRERLTRDIVRRRDTGEILMFYGNVRIALSLGSRHKRATSKTLYIGTADHPTMWVLGDPGSPPSGSPM